MIEITIPGTPTAKGRARAMRMGKTGIRMYTPPKTASYEATCRYAAMAAMAGTAPLTGPLLVTFFLHMPIPASLSLKKQVELNGKPHVKKPDVSNILKAVEDALNGIVWHDDSQIAHLTAHKVYSLEPRVVVRVSEVLDLEAA
jgi:Holliday junction resolvase RusA-like endonuclease